MHHGWALKPVQWSHLGILWPEIRRVQRYYWLRCRGLTILALIAGLIGTGCNRQAAAPALVRPFAGQVIRAAVPDGPAKRVMQRLGTSWANQQGAKLSIVDWHPNQAVPDNCDLVAFNPALMGRLVADDALAPLPASVTASASWSTLTRPFQTKLLGWGNATYALPLIGDATLMIYRPDLLAAAKLRPPESFDEFLETAQTIASERNRPSLPPLNSDEELERVFFTVAAAYAVPALTDSDVKKKAGNDANVIKGYGFHFDIETGLPRLTEPGFVRALQWLKASQTCRAQQGSWVGSFVNDDAVLGLGTLADLAALQPMQHPKRYAVAAVPASLSGEVVPYFGPGGVVAAVTKRAQAAQAALALLIHLSDLPASLEVVHSPEFGAAPYRAAHLTERADGWFNWGLDRAGSDALRAALAKATNPRVINAPGRLRIREEAKYRRIMLDGLREVLNKDADPAKTLQAVAERWEKVDARPADEKREEYLRSLNLKR